MKIKRDHIYLFIVVLASTIASLTIWNMSQSIVYNATISIVNAHDDKKNPPAISIKTPTPLSKIESPLRIAGDADRTWFFEGSFPIKVIDENGKVLGQGLATEFSDGMTEKLVPFEANISFDNKEVKKGFIVFEPYDPSDEANYRSIKIPIIFAKTEELIEVPVSCKVTGCSGQICSDENVISTCEYKAEYACYKKAKCERQYSGKCGWTTTSTFDTCMQDAAVDGDPNYPI